MARNQSKSKRTMITFSRFVLSNLNERERKQQLVEKIVERVTDEIDRSEIHGERERVDG